MSSPPNSSNLVAALPNNCSASGAHATSTDHAAHADEFACEQNFPMRMYKFDIGEGPAGQQASLERQGWNGKSREIVGLVCPFHDCGHVIMKFVAASSALARVYKNRLSGKQFAKNRRCTLKWEMHRKDETKSGKKRKSCRAHVHGSTPVAPAVGNTSSELKSQENSDAEGQLAKKPKVVHVRTVNSHAVEERPLSQTESQPQVLASSTAAQTPTVTVENAGHDVYVPAKGSVLVTLPSTLTLAQLATAPPELLIKNGAAVDKIVELMRPFLPELIGELEQCELDEGLASLQADIVQRMEEKVKFHKLVPQQPSTLPEGTVTYEVPQQHQFYHVPLESRNQFGWPVIITFGREISENSAWLANQKKITQLLPDWPRPQPPHKSATTPGSCKYRNGFRISRLAVAMIQVLYPHFVKSRFREISNICCLQDFNMLHPWLRME